MAAHNDLGRNGEDMAVDLLKAKGYNILHRNWRCGHKELDIVAETSDLLVVVEVKTRKDTLFGNPEEALTNGKIRRIVSSTDAYLRKYAIDKPVRFDLITIVTDVNEPKINHIEDAFYPPLF